MLVTQLLLVKLLGLEQQMLKTQISLVIKLGDLHLVLKTLNFLGQNAGSGATSAQRFKFLQVQGAGQGATNATYSNYTLVRMW
jgi:hypothetical protein